MTSAAPLLLASFPLALIAAALSDLQRFIIPNWISLFLIAGFAVAFAGGAAMGGLGFADLAGHLGVGAGGLLLGFALWACGLWGGGDGKLLAAAALWFDPSSAVQLMFAVVLCGGACAVIALLLNRYRSVLVMIPGIGLLPFEKYAQTVPYGLPIAAGAILALPNSGLYQALSTPAGVS